jgi:hypothetical protein
MCSHVLVNDILGDCSWRKSQLAITQLLRMWALLLRFAGLFVVVLFSRPAMQAPR